MNKEFKEILFDDAQVAASCNTINTIDELYIILQKINWMNESYRLYLEMYRDGYAIKNKDSGTFSWTKKGLNYLINAINSEYILPEHLNLEFIEARHHLDCYCEDPIISLELARVLYGVSNRELIYNDNLYTAFKIGEYGVYVEKIDNKAYLIWSKITDSSQVNGEYLLDYFLGDNYDAYDEPDYDEYDYDIDTVNGKVYLSDGVWIDKKDKWW